MNEKITFPQLAEALSKMTGCSHSTSEQFLKALFESVSEDIASGKKVNLDGLGQFAVNDDRTDIDWTPDQELAETINEPFSAFVPVELGEGITEEVLDGNVPIPETVTEEPEPKEPETVEEEEPASEPEPSEPVAEPSEEEPEEVEPTEPTEPADSEESEPADMEPEPEPGVTDESGAEIENSAVVYRERRRNPLLPWMFFLVGLLAGLTIGYIAGRCYFTGDIKSGLGIDQNTPDTAEVVEVLPVSATESADSVENVADSVAVNDTIPAKPAVPEPKEITDTITRERYLTTMARKYYGDFRFWIYIYKENISKIDNPDRIKPGTVVVIPPAEKYGIDINDKESLKLAEKKIKEFYQNKRAD